MDKNIHNLKYASITEQILKAAFKVHTAIGPGFPEVIYQRSMMIELSEMGLKCSAERSMDVFYFETKVGSRRLDLIVEEKVLVELKAIKELDNYEYSQVINYLHVFKIEVGLLLNFGRQSLKYKRFVNSRI
ncbi:MAG: GxxExxY protein [Gloeobacteraceae cyanobacterium ES-bin-316]|nr:GxxExxY protein [Ferruginibacter sp.]